MGAILIMSPVQYLQMLSNSLIAGALVGAYVALLVLQLHPPITFIPFSEH